MFQNQRWHELESQRAYSTTESQADLNRTSHLSVSELLFLKILAHHSSNFIVGKEVGGRLQLKKNNNKKREPKRRSLGSWMSLATLSDVWLAAGWEGNEFSLWIINSAETRICYANKHIKWMHFPCSIAPARKFVENIVLPLTEATCQIQTWCEWAQVCWFQWHCAHSHQVCNWSIVFQRLSWSKKCQSADKQIL